MRSRLCAPGYGLSTIWIQNQWCQPWVPGQEEASQEKPASEELVSGTGLLLDRVAQPSWCWRRSASMWASQVSNTALAILVGAEADKPVSRHLKAILSRNLGRTGIWPEKKENRVLNGKNCHLTKCLNIACSQELGVAVAIIIIVLGCCFCALLWNQWVIY